MTRWTHVVAAALIAALVAACQTSGAGPSPTAAALLSAQGYRTTSADRFNRDLQPDDIRTTAVYVCEDRRCGGVGIVGFGEEPVGSSNEEELTQLAARPRGRDLRAATRIIRSVGLSNMQVTNYALERLPDGARVFTLDLRGPIATEIFHLRMTAIYRGGPGRLVMAASTNRAVAMRFGGRELLLSP